MTTITYGAIAGPVDETDGTALVDQLFGPQATGSGLFIYRAMTDADDSTCGFDIRAGDNDGIDPRALFRCAGLHRTTPRADGFLRMPAVRRSLRGDDHADGSQCGRYHGRLLPVPVRERP